MVALWFKYIFMNNTIARPVIREMVEVEHYQPAISIILPFDPKMVGKAAIALRLKDAARQVEQALLDSYSSEMVFLMMQKLKTIFDHLNFSTHKKSLVIYLSPVFEKVLYLDIMVEEKIVVDTSFEIRDLLYSKKQMQQYLVLMISARESRIYVGDGSKLVRIVSNPASVAIAGSNDCPERVENFADPAHRREVFMDKFLHQVENSLELILRAYPLPLFVMGSKKIVGHFHKVTRHPHAIIDCIYGNHEHVSLADLHQVLLPHISDWKWVKEQALLQKLDEAAGKQKLVTGIKNVWQESNHHKGWLLVIEKNYQCAGFTGINEDILYHSIAPLVNYSPVKDAVDDIIEKVLENGGDVEMVDDGILKAYEKIALIKYY